MAYASSEGGYGAGASVFHFDPSHSDYISVPDAELLFRGHFGRSGPDLTLTGQDGHHHIIPGYFSSEHHPALVAPNGASLSAELVDLLAGSPAPGQYAQANGATLPADAIGKVEKVIGNVTVLRNGTSVVLHVGDAVYKSDVVETGANSSVGIAFPDGTALDLVANTRMALNEYSFDAAGTSNGAVFTLVEGTFAFVAGQVAHTGNGMKIGTPVATMGIRGTVGLFKSETTIVNSKLGHVWSVFLHEDLDGSHHLGRIAFVDQDPTSPTFGQVFYLLDSSDYIAYLEPQGSGLPPVVRLQPITTSRLFDDRHFFDDLGQILNLYSNINPQTNPNSPGSSTPPDLLQIPPQLFEERGGQPLFINFQFTGENNSVTTPSYGFLPGLPSTKTPQPPPSGPSPTPSGPSSTIFIWSSGPGNWDTPPGWNVGSVPATSGDTVEILSGTVTYNDNYTIGSLILAQGTTLDIVGGSLTVANVVNDGGTIELDGDPPILIMDGPVTVQSTGKIVVLGSGSEVEFTGGTVDNHGVIAARHGGTVDFTDEGVTNEADARIVSRGKGSLVDFADVNLDNLGVIAARHHGNVSFFDGTVTNEAGGEFKSVGHGSSAAFFDTNFSNLGTVVSKDGGKVGFLDAPVDNEKGGKIEAERDSSVSFAGTEILNEAGAVIGATGRGALVTISGGPGVTNPGTFLATSSGAILFADVSVDNQDHGKIEADRGFIGFEDVTFTNEPGGPSGSVVATNWGAIDFRGGSVENGDSGDDAGALFLAKDHGSITFEGTKNSFLGITNDSGGKFEATGSGSTISFDGKHVSVTNDGTFVARDHGAIIFDHVSSVVNEDGGAIEAKAHGTVVFNGVSVTNDDGTSSGLTDGSAGLIAAIGCDARVKLADSTIIGGTIKTRNGGVIETVWGNNTFLNVTLDGAVVQVDCGTSLALSGGSSGTAAVIDGKVTLEGPGVVTMAYQSYTIVSGTPRATLVNDTEIVGAGTIGTGDGSLTLVNDGIVAALYLGHDHGDFVIDTGIGAHGTPTTINDGYIVAFGDKAVMQIEDTTLDNLRRGTIAAVDYGTVKIEDSVVKGGTIVALHYGTVELDGAIIKDSTLDTSHQGVIETVADHGHTTSTFNNVTNEGFVLVQSNTSLAFEGTIVNDGMIVVDAESGSDSGAQLVIDGKVILAGCGTVELDGRHDEIIGGPDGGKLINFSTISGYGKIGSGDDSDLTLKNEAGAVIDADFNGKTLAVDTGHTLTNEGTLEASNGGTLLIDDPVINSGAGNALIEGGLVDFASTTKVDEITFNNGSGTPTYGELILGDLSGGFTATINGFAGTAHNLSHSDGIDLAGIFTVQSETCSDGNVVLDLKDGCEVVSLTFDDFSGTLHVGTDGHGGTLITDPPAANSSNPSVSIGGPANDTFVFHPGIGADTINNFNPTVDTIELDHFANAQSLQQLASLITTDTHGDALIELGHNDSIAIPGMTAAYLQAHLQSLVHLH
jgi:hypothetical protein